MSIFVLKPGDTIGVMAPSSAVEGTDIEASKALLEERGYRVFVHPQSFAREHQSAGSHQDKIAALHELYGRRDIKAIWAAGGGNRALHLLDHLDNALIDANPKPLIGFSDVTALINTIGAESGYINYHGPVFKDLHQYEALDQALDVLSGKASGVFLSGAEALRTGEASGPLLGGNLSILQYLPPALFDGGILFLEDCNEELSKVDRMLLHLGRSGVFARASGLIFGQFTDMLDSGRPFGYTLEELIDEHTGSMDIPVLIGAPIGHTKTSLTLPVHRLVKLDSAARKISW